MHDALSAEQTGVAATAVITDRFVQTAQVMARVAGMADYPFAVIPHPIANNMLDTLREKACQALRQCVGHLVQS